MLTGQQVQLVCINNINLIHTIVEKSEKGTVYCSFSYMLITIYLNNKPLKNRKKTKFAFLAITIIVSVIAYNEVSNNSISYTGRCTDVSVAQEFKINVSWIVDYGRCDTLKSKSIFNYNQESVLLGRNPINEDFYWYELEIIHKGKFVYFNKINIRDSIVSEIDYIENDFIINIIVSKTDTTSLEEVFFDIFIENKKIPVKAYLKISSRFMYQKSDGTIRENDLHQIKNIISQLIQTG